MKDCVLVVLLLAIVSNTFGKPSIYFSTTSGAPLKKSRRDDIFDNLQTIHVRYKHPSTERSNTFGKPSIYFSTSGAPLKKSREDDIFDNLQTIHVKYKHPSTERSNTFGKPSTYFSTTSGAPLKKSREDDIFDNLQTIHVRYKHPSTERSNKSEINTTKSTKEHKQSSLSFDLASAFEKLFMLRHSSSVNAFINELINERISRPHSRTSISKVLEMPLVDLLLPEKFNIFDKLLWKDEIMYSEDLEDPCNKARRRTIGELWVMYQASQYTMLDYKYSRIIDEIDACLRNLELRIKQLTDKDEISTTEPTKDYKLETDVTESTENHKPKISITEPTKGYRLEINVTESTENHKPEINTSEPIEDYKSEISTTELTEDHKPEINTTKPTEDHKQSSLSLDLTSTIEKFNKLKELCSLGNATEFLVKLIKERGRDLSSKEFSEIKFMPFIDLLLPEQFNWSEFWKKEEHFDLTCHRARRLLIPSFRCDFMGYYLRMFNRVEVCLRLLEFRIKESKNIEQNSHTQSTEFNVAHEIDTIEPHVPILLPIMSETEKKTTISPLDLMEELEKLSNKNFTRD